MTLLYTVFAFLVALAILVVVHELGHYWVARLCGVKVLRFSVGMGKIVWSRRYGRDQTEWAISMLPFGGYVKMLDAREQDIGTLSESDLKREFTRQPVGKRMAIVAAGPLANFILAIIVFAGLYIHGMPEPAALLRTVPEATAAHAAGLRGGERIATVNGEAVEGWTELRWKLMQAALDKTPAHLGIVHRDQEVERDGAVTLGFGALEPEDLEGDFLGRLGLELARPPAVLGRLVENGPAAQAGLREGDRIIRVGGEPVADGLAFIEKIRNAPGRSLRIEGMRDGVPLDLNVIPESVASKGQTVGRIQAEVTLTPEMVVARDSLGEATAKAVRKTWDTSVLTLKMLGKMLTGEVSWKNVTGPITIADYAGQTARVGWISYLTFIAFISISLGVMNLLPIPVLDGGLLLYYSLELLTGRALPERIGEMAQRAGVGILMTLMAVAVFNDIMRLMS